MALFMKENGVKTNSMAKAKSPGLIKLCTKAIIVRVLNTDRVDLHGQTTQATRVNSLTIIFVATAFTNGQITDVTRVSGRIIKCTVKEFFNGPTAEFTKDSITRIKKKEKAYSLGPTEEGTRDLGKLESSTGKALSLIDKE